MKEFLYILVVCFSSALFFGCGGGSSTPTNGSAPSAPTGVSVTPQAVPHDLTATAGYGAIDLSWSAVSGATSYNVYWSTAAGVTKSTGTKIENITPASYTHNNIEGGTTLYYIITAVTSIGETSESDEVNATAGYRVFISSTEGSGVLGTWEGGHDLTGVAAGDAICLSLAEIAGLTGTYMAWLSDASYDAKDRFTAAGPWGLLDGYKVADSMDNLVDGYVDTPITIDESGNDVGGFSTYVWTGTLADGTKSTSSHCTNWSVLTTPAGGLVGRAYIQEEEGDWTFSTTYPCTNELIRLYCFEQ